MISIIDYGMGNLRSVQKALARLGYNATIIERPEQIAQSDRLILPGVGAFRDAMQRIRELALIEPIQEHVEAGKPFLGICLGLQLLFETSYEDGEHAGLGIVPGTVERFPEAPGLKVPHMGWNRLEPVASDLPMFTGLPAEPYVYFVHSYHAVPADPAWVAAYSEHGVRFPAAVLRESLWATQFHPEKSQSVGLKLLQNFVRLAG